MPNQSPPSNAAVAPGSVIQQVEQAVEATIKNPSPEQIIADLETALQLFAEFKSALGGLDPSVMNIVKTALSLLL